MSSTNCRPVCIEDIGPLVALQYGYLEGAAELLDRDAPLRMTILNLLREFNQTVEQFPIGSRERLYLMELRMIASGLAQGMTHRSRVRTDRLMAAKQEREVTMRRIVQTQTMAGVLRGGAQLLLVGGFAYALVGAIFSLPRVAAKAGEVQKDFASLATATGSALVGSFFKAWWMGFRVRQISRKYDTEIARVNREYSESMKQEYRLAASEANLAWKRLTGRDPEVTTAFQELLMEVMAGDQRALGLSPDAVDARASLGHFSGLLTSLRTRLSRTPAAGGK